MRNCELGREARTLQRGNPYFAYVLKQRSQRPSLALPELGELGIAPSHQETLGVRRGLTVANENNHGSSKRPHSGQTMKVPAAWPFQRSWSRGERAIRHPSQRPPSTSAAPEVPTRANVLS